MNTLTLLIRNLSNRFFPTSALDGILAQGFEQVMGPEIRNLPEDCELYEKGDARIIYNGRTDEVVNRYLFHSPAF
jgi:hypothetical protein